MAWIMKNWRTTLAGVAGILSGLGMLGGAISEALKGNFNWGLFMAAFSAISVGVGLLAAKDANVTGGSVQNAAPKPSA